MANKGEEEEEKKGRRGVRTEWMCVHTMGKVIFKFRSWTGERIKRRREKDEGEWEKEFLARPKSILVREKKFFIVKGKDGILFLNISLYEHLYYASERSRMPRIWDVNFFTLNLRSLQTLRKFYLKNLNVQKNRHVATLWDY